MTKWRKWLVVFFVLNFAAVAGYVTTQQMHRNGIPSIGKISSVSKNPDLEIDIPNRPLIQAMDQANSAQVEIANLRSLAFDIAENTLRQLPKNPAAFCLLGKLHLRSGNVHAARSLWDMSIAINPDIVEAYIDYGHYELNLGNYDKAENYFRKAIDKDPSFTDGYRFIAGTQLAQRNYTKAIQHFEQYLAKSPNSVATWCQLGLAYQQLGKHADSIRSYLRASALDENSSAAAQGLMTAYRSQGDHLNARKYADILSKLTDEAPRVAEDRSDQAPDLFKVKDVLDFTCRTATSLLVQARKTEAAIAQLERAKVLAPNASSIRSELINLYTITNAVEGVTMLLRERCDASPDDANSWIAIGVHYLRTRRLDAADGALRKAIALEPNRAESYALLSQVQMPKGRNPAGAVENARQAVTLSPTASNHFILGTALYHVGDLVGSRQHVLKAVDLEPRNPEFQAALERL